MATLLPETTALARAWRSLNGRRFFKLICGGSFTEIPQIETLVRTFAMAGADCIDLAPDRAVLSAVEDALAQLPPGTPRPLVMVSLPLDPDPHFRKIELVEPDCIRCGACVPVCPAEAITLPQGLEISQTLCYGCGRCVPVCPTEALHLLPFQMEGQIEAVLSHPVVEALEIHSRHVDPLMLEAFLSHWKPRLQGKLIALCFNPTAIEEAQWLDFVRTARRFAGENLILQIDGAPMSGSDDPGASLPAIQAARTVQDVLQTAEYAVPVTISGGINRATAAYLRAAENEFIAGVGMGTMARKLIRAGNTDPALPDGNPLQAARKLVALFKQSATSAIMEVSEEGTHSGQARTF